MTILDTFFEISEHIFIVYTTGMKCEKSQNNLDQPSSLMSKIGQEIQQEQVQISDKNGTYHIKLNNVTSSHIYMHHMYLTCLLM